MYELKYIDGDFARKWLFSTYSEALNKENVLVNVYDYDPDCFTMRKLESK